VNDKYCYNNECYRDKSYVDLYFSLLDVYDCMMCCGLTVSTVEFCSLRNE
jgi:hypothetical protein